MQVVAPSIERRVAMSRGVRIALLVGLAWATGSLAALVTGSLPDHIGAYSADLTSRSVILLAFGLALHAVLRRVTGTARAS